MQVYPLSSNQKHIWLDQCLHPENPTYNIGGYVSIRGEIDFALLEQALGLVLREADAMRIFLGERDGVPYQSFGAFAPYRVPVIDFSTAPDPMASACRHMQDAFVVPFQPGEYPLFRIRFLKLSDHHSLWFGTFHHIITDDLGIALLVKGMVENYRNLCAGNPTVAVFPRYASFIEEDLRYQDSARFEQDRAYWCDRLANLPPLLFSKEEDEILVAQRYTRVIHACHYETFTGVARSLGVTPSNLFLSLLCIYLARILTRDRFVIGLPILNRRSPAARRTIGFFAEVTPFLMEIDTRLPFRTILTEIRKKLRRDYRHQRFPLGEIHHLVGKSGEQHALFDVTLSYEKHDYRTLFSGFDSEVVGLSNRQNREPLSISIRESPGQDVQIHFDYQTDRFSQEQIEGFYKQMERLYLELARDPDRAPAHICFPDPKSATTAFERVQSDDQGVVG